MENIKKIRHRMRELTNVQGGIGNWNYDNYMLGMYNGMELMLSIAEGREPVYKECEDKDMLYHKQDKVEPIGSVKHE